MVFIRYVAAHLQRLGFIKQQKEVSEDTKQHENNTSTAKPLCNGNSTPDGVLENLASTGKEEEEEEKTTMETDQAKKIVESIAEGSKNDCKSFLYLK